MEMLPEFGIATKRTNRYIAPEEICGTFHRAAHVLLSAGKLKMKQEIIHVAVVVADYDEAIEFYTQKLKFVLVEDTYQPEQKKRWVVVAPPGSRGTNILLAKASKPEQNPFVGNQTGGRVFLFLSTDDFWRDYNDMTARGITFVRQPVAEPYGTVAVFRDLYGNLWDLVQLTNTVQ